MARRVFSISRNRACHYFKWGGVVLFEYLLSSLWRATRSNGDGVIDLQHNSQGVGNSGLSMRKAGGFVQREAVILTGGI